MASLRLSLKLHYLKLRNSLIVTRSLSCGSIDSQFEQHQTIGSLPDHNSTKFIVSSTYRDI